MQEIRIDLTKGYITTAEELQGFFSVPVAVTINAVSRVVCVTADATGKCLLLPDGSYLNRDTDGTLYVTLPSATSTKEDGE